MGVLGSVDELHISLLVICLQTCKRSFESLLIRFCSSFSAVKWKVSTALLNCMTEEAKTYIITHIHFISYSTLLCVLSSKGSLGTRLPSPISISLEGGSETPFRSTRLVMLSHFEHLE